MYEEYTYENIMERMMERVESIADVDTSEGSLIYTALAPCAWELSEAYMELDEIYENTFAETAPREQLILRAKERGIEPVEATNAIFKCELTPSIVELDGDETFTLDEYTYSIVEKITDGYYKVQCETAGKEPNNTLGELYPSDYIDGLESATLTELLIPGMDEEDTEDFRDRYFATFNNQAFGGNKADYKEKIKEITGVGAVKVYRRTIDNFNILIQILNSDYGIPSDELVSTVQTVICPNQGEGDGLAPIGHNVKIEGAVKKNIDISMNITFDNGYSLNDVTDQIDDAIDAYLLSLSKGWENTTAIVVRVSQIISALVKIQGILDVSEVTLNETSDNLTLLENEIPERSEINVIG